MRRGAEGEFLIFVEELEGDGAGFDGDCFVFDKIEEVVGAEILRRDLVVGHEARWPR